MLEQNSLIIFSLIIVIILIAIDAARVRRKIGVYAAQKDGVESKINISIEELDGMQWPVIIMNRGPEVLCLHPPIESGRNEDGELVVAFGRATIVTKEGIKRFNIEYAIPHKQLVDLNAS